MFPRAKTRDCSTLVSSQATRQYISPMACLKMAEAREHANKSSIGPRTLVSKFGNSSSILRRVVRVLFVDFAGLDFDGWIVSPADTDV